MISGLYAITPEEPDTEKLVNKVRLALQGGARCIQYRNKTLSSVIRLSQATRLLKLCREFSVPLIINDDVELALEIDADGVHLGKEDASFHEAINRFKSGKILGVSCYNRLDIALSAQRAGASYVAFGSFFPSLTKPLATSATPSLLQIAKKEIKIPIVAIGGVTIENAIDLIQAGADAIAVISSLFEAADIEATAQKFDTLFR